MRPLRQPCFVRSGGKDTREGAEVAEKLHVRAAKIRRTERDSEPGMGQRRWAHLAPSCHRGSTTACVSSSPGKPQESHGRDTKKQTGWGQGLIPDVAGGSSRKDKSKHSLYLAWWPGQTASQM